MMFFERFEKLCREKGVSMNAVGKELGIPSGSLTAWKNGTQPRINSLNKIAEYFNVSTDFLIGGIQKEKQNDDVIAKNEAISKLINIVSQVSLDAAQNILGYATAFLAQEQAVKGRNN